MSKFKQGDIVRQIKVSRPEQERYLGRIGTVVEIRKNTNMAVYGKGEEVIVQFDGDNSKWIEYETQLERIG